MCVVCVVSVVSNYYTVFWDTKIPLCAALGATNGWPEQQQTTVADFQHFYFIYPMYSTIISLESCVITLNNTRSQFTKGFL